MQRVAFVVFPGFQIMSLAAMSVFEFANLEAPAPRYDVTVVSERGGAVADSAGLRVETKPFGRTAFDTVIVCGGVGAPPPLPRVVAYLRRAVRRSRRVVSICTGAFLLGEAGLLDGRRATTHWLLARELASRFPSIRLDDDRIYTIDGPIWTSAGMSAGLDVALALVEADHGAALARTVARKFVLYHRRAGGQSQFSALLDLEAKSDRIQTALVYARRNLKRVLSVDELAAAANLSARQFSRAFRSETGQSPAKAVERLRVEAARLMLDETRHPVDVVARETGFADRERMRRAFVRAFGQPPQALRRHARETG
jgi:transcriptional regulator GlxA family with amidase domain